jgi:hypothetical protein
MWSHSGWQSLDQREKRGRRGRRGGGSCKTGDDLHVKERPWRASYHVELPQVVVQLLAVIFTTKDIQHLRSHTRKNSAQDGATGWMHCAKSCGKGHTQEVHLARPDHSTRKGTLVDELVWPHTEHRAPHISWERIAGGSHHRRAPCCCTGSRAKN